MGKGPYESAGGHSSRPQLGQAGAPQTRAEAHHPMLRPPSRAVSQTQVLKPASPSLAAALANSAGPLQMALPGPLQMAILGLVQTILLRLVRMVMLGLLLADLRQRDC